MAEGKNTSIIIFGASGDLTHRKLIPALYHLYCKGRLSEPFNILGLSRSDLSDEDFRNDLQEGAREFTRDQYDDEEWRAFAKNVYYTPFDITNPEAYKAAGLRLAAIEGGDANRLYYLATAPRFFPIAVQHMGRQGWAEENGGWRRVIVEKPFGNDLQSAKELNNTIHKYLDENQIYRIDHYLAKETVQNILVFRFGNTIFEPIWNRNYIDHVQITAAESVDVGHRGGYYDKSGVLRDMFQNHLLQLLSLVSMEAPASFEADALRNEKVKALSVVRRITPETVADNVVRAQYHGYRETKEVDPNSDTPTYAAVRLYLDNWRWQGVPFYLRSGKGLHEKSTEILIKFKSPPHMMFPMPPDKEIRSNLLSICVQPDEGIHLRFEAKVPDTPAEMRSVDMEFHYSDDFGGIAIPEAYERLLLDALRGDPSLFTRADGIEHAWGIIDPILHALDTDHAPPVAFYKQGSWGPAEADELLSRDGRHWQLGCAHD